MDHNIFGFSTEVFSSLYTYFGNEHLLTTPLLLTYYPTYGTLKKMTLAQHMHYIYLTTDMNMVTLMIL